MIRDMIDTFWNSAPAAIEKLVRKNQIETSTSHGIPSWSIWSVNHVVLRYVTLIAQFLKYLYYLQRGMNNYQPHCPIQDNDTSYKTVEETVFHFFP